MEIFKLVGSIFVKSEEAEKAIDDTSKKAKELADTVGTKMKTVGDKMSSLGTKLMPVTLAIAGIGTVAVKSSAEMKALNSQFEQTFGELQGQASDALNRVATESGILQTRLQGVGTSIYAFAKSSGADSAEAMSLMETALRATADASAYYDRSLEETSESLMSFLKGNFANDAQLGVSCTETTRNAKAMELFGQKYNDLSEIQKQQTLLKMVTDAQALSGAMGQAQRESDGFENVTGNLTESLKILGAELGEVLLPTVIKMIQKATEIIQKFSNMDDGTKKFIVTLALVVGAVAPVLIVIGKLTSGVGAIIIALPKIIAGFKTLTGVTQALWLVMQANPIILIGTAITALIVIVSYLWDNCAGFRNFWISMWEGMKREANNAKENIKNIINQMKSFFNFTWSLPKLKMPHFSVSGKFSLNPLSVPKFSISWYKKAMDNPMMFTRPTIFGLNPMTGQMKGAGEAGDEVMIGKNTMLNMIQEAVAQENAMMMDSVNNVLNRIFDLLSENLPEMAHTQLVLDTGVMVGELAPAMDTALGAVYRKRKRGV